jgi:hypothetical protein
MAKQYRVTLTFTGNAAFNVEADNTEAAREKAMATTLEDLAKQGFADVTNLKLSLRDVSTTTALYGGDDDDETAPRKPRPSGWYRPA